jgi:hypothetical protein
MNPTFGERFEKLKLKYLMTSFTDDRLLDDERSALLLKSDLLGLDGVKELHDGQLQQKGRIQ